MNLQPQILKKNDECDFIFTIKNYTLYADHYYML